MILVAGSKTDGIASLRRRAGEILPVAGHAAKYHGAVFWLERGEDVSAAAARLSTKSTVEVDGFRTAPGMFSHDRIDPGSRLLVTNLPDDLGGEVADFGAGWGYLSAEVLLRSDKVARLDLYEADFASLEAAKVNVAAIAGSRALGFFWRDLLEEPVGRRYDAIVMNPPFHKGAAADPALGQGMIAAAARALNPGGRLFLVANRGLPYEAELKRLFSAFGEVCRDDAFKLLWGRR